MRLLFLSFSASCACSSASSHPSHTIFSPFLSLHPVPHARCLVLSVFPRRSILLSVAQGRSSSLHVDESQIATGRVSNRAEATRPTPKVLPRSCHGSRDPLGARQTDTTPLLGRKRTARGQARAKDDDGDTLTARQLSFRDA